jgi:single stranded DNA-binding protein
MSLPTIEITGNINKLNTKYLPSGKQVTSFQIECSEKDKNGNWNNLYLKGEVWEKSAQFVQQYFKDGDVATVTGKLYTNVYDKQDGSKAYEVKFMFPNISFPPKAKDQTQQSYQQPQQQQYSPQAQQMAQQAINQLQSKQPPVIDVDSDEVPF